MTVADRKAAAQVDKEPPNPVSKMDLIQAGTNWTDFLRKLGCKFNNPLITGNDAIAEAIWSKEDSYFEGDNPECSQTNAKLMWQWHSVNRRFLSGSGNDFGSTVQFIKMGCQFDSIPLELQMWIDATFRGRQPPLPPLPPPPPLPTYSSQVHPPPNTTVADRVNLSEWSKEASQIFQVAINHCPGLRLRDLLEDAGVTSITALLPPEVAAAQSGQNEVEPCGTFWIQGKCTNARCRFDHTPRNVEAPPTDAKLLQLRDCVRAVCSRPQQ
jgi:hypothetical protein